MEKLEILIERYGNNKTEMDSYKKQVDLDNKDIKSIMATEGLKEFTAGGYTAKYSVSVSESFDEEKLVNRLKELWSANGSMTNPYLEMVYVPNMEAIENAIYNGKLNAADLSDCRVRKETPRLTIAKEKKNGSKN